MARTTRTPENKARPYYRREDKAHRKAYRRKLRRIAKAALAAGREIPREVRTSGWLTW